MPTAVATALFIREVRKFAVQTPDWAEAKRYETLPDERHDLTLVALRVYGSRDEFLTIMAAAGLDTLEQVLPEQTLVLPTWPQLQAIKRKTKYLTDDEARAIEALN
ncbi:hypothetical protein [Cupriavidus pauculus]|uniref:hypothetical protein n=1 Tax=Cupriavidus pauculus TaxID=82633 RepID=UPI001D0C8E41|nr:hypothetical protein [Cupriavidus pauculus]